MNDIGKNEKFIDYEIYEFIQQQHQWSSSFTQRLLKPINQTMNFNQLGAKVFN